MKKFLKFAVISLFCAALCAGTLTGCGENAEKPEKNQAETETEIRQVDSTGAQCPLIPSVYELYQNFSESVFAILKLDYVEDAFYNKLYPGSVDDLYLILECTVEEDYFHKLESGTKIHLPLNLSDYKNDPYSDLEPLKTMLGQTERLLVYTSQLRIEPEFKNTVTNEIFTWEGIEPIYYTSLMEFIPIREDKVDFDPLYDLFGESDPDRYEDFTKYIDDGMPLETLKENLRELAEKVEKEEPMQ